MITKRRICTVQLSEELHAPRRQSEIGLAGSPTLNRSTVQAASWRLWTSAPRHNPARIPLQGPEFAKGGRGSDIRGGPAN